MIPWIVLEFENSHSSGLRGDENQGIYLKGIPESGFLHSKEFVSAGNSEMDVTSASSEGKRR